MLHASLRAHTRPHHERIELALDLPDSVRDKDDYARLLGGLYGFYQVHERRLEAQLGRIALSDLALPSRRKAGKLRDDLRGCGLDDVEIDRLPACPALPRVDTPGRALGSMYVLEGSTLGGHIIAQALQPRLQLHAASQMTFLTGYGERTGAMWREFVRVLDSTGLAPEEHLEALDGAADTFDAMRGWLGASWRSDC